MTIRTHSHRLRLESGIRHVAREIAARKRSQKYRLAAYLLPNGEVMVTRPYKAGKTAEAGALFGTYGKQATPRQIAGDLCQAIREGR